MRLVLPVVAAGLLQACGLITEKPVEKPAPPPQQVSTAHEEETRHNGRYAIHAVQNGPVHTAVLVDTATGDTWFVCGDSKSVTWCHDTPAGLKP
jgi:hypothetical protein